MVVQTKPLLVACYCDDLDGVCLLRFRDSLADLYKLNVGTRLLTVLNSHVGTKYHRPVWDVIQGNHAVPRYINFWPLIAEFLSDEHEKIELRKTRILDSEYERCWELAQIHLSRHQGMARIGRPDKSMIPMSQWQKWWFR